MHTFSTPLKDGGPHGPGHRASVLGAPLWALTHRSGVLSTDQPQVVALVPDRAPVLARPARPSRLDRFLEAGSPSLLSSCLLLIPLTDSAGSLLLPSFQKQGTVVKNACCG